MEVAGRIAADTSPWVRPTSSPRLMQLPGPYDVLQPGARLLERELDAAQRLARLLPDVVSADRAAVLRCCCRAGD